MKSLSSLDIPTSLQYVIIRVLFINTTFCWYVSPRSKFCTKTTM